MSEKKQSDKKPNFFKSFGGRVGKFLRDCKGELKKIVWPTTNTVFKNMGVVLATMLILGVFIFLLDTVFMQLLGLVMDIAN